MPRPIRSLSESISDRVPRGPLGFIGRGNAIGALGFTTVGIINTFLPIDGVDVGYNIESHSVDRQNDTERHTFEINSASKDVARFVAKINSSPSNIDFALRETEIVSIQPLVERTTFNTWEIIVEVDDRTVVEDIEDNT